MNHLKTTDTGGMPLRLDDFRWIDDAQKEAFKATIKTLIGSAEAAILFGCTIEDTEQGDVWTCTEGFVYFNDEIYYVEAHSVVHDSNWLYFIEEITYQTPEGLKTFEDAGQHETYEIRRAVLNSGSSQPASTALYNIDDVMTILGVRLNLYQPPAVTAWTEQLLTSSNVSITGEGTITSISGKIRYKASGKRAFVAIDLTVTVTAPGPIIQIQIPGAITIKREIYVSSIIPNITVRPADNTVPEGLYKVSAEAYPNHLAIASLYSGENLVAGSYHFYGEIFFEIQ